MLGKSGPFILECQEILERYSKLGIGMLESLGRFLKLGFSLLRKYRQVLKNWVYTC
jgi:hypothetical protein